MPSAMSAVDPDPDTLGKLLNPGVSKRAFSFLEALSECKHNDYVVGGQPGRNSWILTPIVSVEIMQGFPREQSSLRRIQGQFFPHHFVVLELERGMCQNDLGRYIKIERRYRGGEGGTRTSLQPILLPPPANRGSSHSDPGPCPDGGLTTSVHGNGLTV